jgi:catechol 2,3-dioxygenase-like lactoylglutathione lyase family enzyme
MFLHHVTLFVRDIERSLPFYRDGLGMQTQVDREFDGDWPTLFGVTSTRLRAVILADPEYPEIGQVELLTFSEPVAAGPTAAPVATATVLLSFQVDLAAVLPALEAAGGSDVRRATLRNGHEVVTLRDPDGILVELLDVAPAAQAAS